MICRGNNTANQGVYFKELLLMTAKAGLIFYSFGEVAGLVSKTNPGFQTRLLAMLEQTLSYLHSRHVHKLTRFVSAVLDRAPRSSYIV